jgi:hypothetical protein
VPFAGGKFRTGDEDDGGAMKKKIRIQKRQNEMGNIATTRLPAIAPIRPYVIN